jgi:MGT family glycosyltransferase
MFRTFFEAVADLPLNAVATIGRDNDPHALGAVPPNVHVARFIPQAELLPHCTAVLHHAGAGTTFGLLAHALPSLAVPQSADNFAIAGRLAAAGAATVLMPDEVTVDSVRQAVRAVVDEPRYRTAAVSLADEIAAMPSPEQVARALAG